MFSEAEFNLICDKGKSELKLLVDEIRIITGRRDIGYGYKEINELLDIAIPDIMKEKSVQMGCVILLKLGKVDYPREIIASQIKLIQTVIKHENKIRNYSIDELKNDNIENKVPDESTKSSVVKPICLAALVCGVIGFVAEEEILIYLAGIGLLSIFFFNKNGGNKKVPTKKTHDKKEDQTKIYNREDFNNIFNVLHKLNDVYIVLDRALQEET